MKKRTTCLTTISVLALLILCATGLLIGVAAYGLPNRVEQIYGPPASGLNLRDKIYLSAQLYLRRSSLTQPGSGINIERPFEIGFGEPTSAVITRLEREGFIQDGDAFRAYLQYKGLDTTLQAGEYRLSGDLTPVEIALALQDATPSEVTFRILPGWRLEEIAAALPTSGLTFNEEEFLAAADTIPADFSFANQIPTGSNLEGFLYPDSYTLKRELGVSEFIHVLLDRFEVKLTDELRQGFDRQGLDLYSAITLASLVEREAMNAEEMPLIASVFYNRLAAGMKLDSDPTVQYALGYNPDQETWWTNPLSLTNLEIDSPFNTYKYPGLPPGPIASPGQVALQAVAFPAKTPYFYFRAACEGSGKHVFSETFEEHASKGCP